MEILVHMFEQSAHVASSVGHQEILAEPGHLAEGAPCQAQPKTVLGVVENPEDLVVDGHRVAPHVQICIGLGTKG